MAVQNPPPVQSADGDDVGEVVDLNSDEWKGAIDAALERRGDAQAEKRRRMGEPVGRQAKPAPRVEEEEPAAEDEPAEEQPQVAQQPAKPTEKKDPPAEPDADADPKVKRGFTQLAEREKHVNAKLDKRQQELERREKEIAAREEDAAFKKFKALQSAATNPVEFLRIAEELGVKDHGALAQAAYAKVLGKDAPAALQAQIQSAEVRAAMEAQAQKIRELEERLERTAQTESQRQVQARVENNLRTHVEKEVTDDDAPLTRAMFADSPERVVAGLITVATRYQEHYGTTPDLPTLVDAFEKALNEEIPSRLRDAYLKGGKSTPSITSKTTPNPTAGETKAAVQLSNKNVASPTKPTARSKKTHELTQEERRELGVALLEELELTPEA